MEQKQEKLYALLNEKLDHTEEISDEEILVEIDKLIWEEAKGQYMPLSEKITLRQQLFNGIRRLDILQELLEDESVTEIMVNGTDGIFVEREGRIRCWEHRFVSKTKLEDVVQQIAGKCNRIVNEAIPITDARLENGSRVNAIVDELRGEKIDIVSWDENPGTLIQTALSPAKIVAVFADPDERTAKVVVPDYQLSLAIGKEGQNARLAARLTGYKIDIKSETQAKDAPGFRYEDYLDDGYDDEEEEYEDDYEEGAEEALEDTQEPAAAEEDGEGSDE